MSQIIGIASLLGGCPVCISSFVANPSCRAYKVPSREMTTACTACWEEFLSPLIERKPKATPSRRTTTAFAKGGV